MTGIELRDGLEIQRAHDILKAIILGEVPFVNEDNPIQRASLHSALDTLCWVLRHRHNTTFEENLSKIEKALESKGFVLRFGGKEPS